MWGIDIRPHTGFPPQARATSSTRSHVSINDRTSQSRFGKEDFTQVDSLYSGAYLFSHENYRLNPVGYTRFSKDSQSEDDRKWSAHRTTSCRGILGMPLYISYHRLQSKFLSQHSVHHLHRLWAEKKVLLFTSMS